MEEKKYEAGRVEISSAEYRDLVTEAVEARRDASESRSEKWRLESEQKKLETKLAEANKRIAELESILSNFQVGLSTTCPNPPAWWSEVTCYSQHKDDN